MNTELFKAILALDAYHRGYRPGLFLESKLGVSKTLLGSAKIEKATDELGIVPGSNNGLTRAEAVSFFAQSYE
ncbi:MAG: hypothetical protein AAFV45_07560 [Pseudomonadota bacterium]